MAKNKVIEYRGYQDDEENSPTQVVEDKIKNKKPKGGKAKAQKKESTSTSKPKTEKLI